MGYTNETTHYGLPLPLGSDLTTPMDYNASLQDVDTALFGAVSDCASMDARLDVAEGNISTAQGDITSLDGRMTTAEGKISTLEGTSAQHTLDIADVRADAQDMICAYKEADAQSDHAYSVGDYFIYNDVLYKATENIGVGDTIVPDTNCTTTNITSEIKALNSEVSITTTGTETWTEALTRLANLVDFSKITSKSVLESTDRAYHVSKTVASNTVEFSECNAASAEVQVRSITVSKTTSSFYISHAGSTYSFTDASSETATSGLVVKIIY